MNRAGPYYGAPQGMYSTMPGGEQAGYSPQGGGLPYAAKAPFRRKRMNVVAICLGQFVPWLVFCLCLALMSFALHYAHPHLVRAAMWTLGFCLAVATLALGVGAMKRSGEEAQASDGSWTLFLVSTSLLALVMAAYFGGRNFELNLEPHYDISNFNTYSQVDPDRMRGQELMDAGSVTFKAGTHIDVKRSMGFKNMDTYCVAPIAGASNTELTNYDFWAVGKNCCDPNDGSDFTCGEYNTPQAMSGIRVVMDQDREFYRLAVQQAQSAYAIKASHPLFFYWVTDPSLDNDGMKRDGYKFFLLAMVGYFCFQLALVAGVTRAFSSA